MPPIPACGAFRIPIWRFPTLGLIPIRGSIPLWHSIVVNPTPVGLGSDGPPPGQRHQGEIITFAVQFLARPSVFELSDGRLVFWLMSIRADMPPHPVRKCRADMSRALVWRLYVRLRSGHVGRANAELGAD